MRERKYKAWDGERFREDFAITTEGIPLHKGDEYPEWELVEYTGLKDSEGKKDWENDVVIATISTVKFYRRIYKAVSGAWVIKLPCLNSTSEDEITLYSIKHINAGNAYENPNLLKD